MLLSSVSFVIFQWGTSSYALYDVESFSTVKCSVKFTYFKSGVLKQRTITLGRRGREKVRNHCSRENQKVILKLQFTN